MDAARYVTALCLLLLAPHVSAADPCSGCFDSRLGRWLKGNTHSHSMLLLRGVIPHGDSSAHAVARWYREHGYDFAVISEHNHLIDVDSRSLREVQDEQFLLLPAVEITSDYRLWWAPREGKRAVHTTALNVKSLPSPEFGAEAPRDILRAHVERTRAAGGITILNHPNYRDQISPTDALGLPGLSLFELYNGEPTARNEGRNGRPSTERLWDLWLTAGHRMYGVAADDAHYFKFDDWLTHERDSFALPGSGWVVVSADRLSRDSIVASLSRGAFYSSTGVVLSDIRYDQDRYVVDVDMRATLAQTKEAFVAEAAPVVAGEPGVTIEFIGSGGAVLERANTDFAAISLDSRSGYVRVRVTWLEAIETRLDDGPKLRRFVAWTQPMFLEPRSLRTSRDEPAQAPAATAAAALQDR